MDKIIQNVNLFNNDFANQFTGIEFMNSLYIETEEIKVKHINEQIQPI